MQLTTADGFIIESSQQPQLSSAGRMTGCDGSGGEEEDAHRFAGFHAGIVSPSSGFDCTALGCDIYFHAALLASCRRLLTCCHCRLPSVNVTLTLLHNLGSIASSHTPDTGMILHTHFQLCDKPTPNLGGTTTLGLCRYEGAILHTLHNRNRPHLRLEIVCLENPHITTWLQCS